MDRKSVIYELLERWGNKPRASLSDGDRILDDVQMDGDDYGMSFVPELQSMLGFKASTSEWERIVTVGDVVQLVESHLGTGGETDLPK